jgi:hypothetical protein
MNVAADHRSARQGRGQTFVSNAVAPLRRDVQGSHHSISCLGRGNRLVDAAGLLLAPLWR